MTFNPTEPVDEIFTEIDNYAEVVNIVNDPISSTQKCKLAYIVLLNTNFFCSGLKEWDKKDRQNQTWDEFKTHFRQVQKQLRQTGDLTIEETISNEELMSIVSENIFEQINYVIREQNTEDNENSEIASSHNDKIS